VIYLILKMMVYLLLAVAAGGGAGWLLRNLAASKREEEMQRTLADARARVPQFESLLRSRDEQIVRLKDDLSEKDVRINSLVDESREKDQALKEKDREFRQLAARAHALDLTESSETIDNATLDVDLSADPTTGQNIAPGGPDVTGQISEHSGSQESSEVHEQIRQLERELVNARATTADAVAEAAAAEAEVITLKAELARAGDADGQEADSAVEELETRLRQKAEEYDRLNRTLETEQRKVAELERERELQNKSLQVLHQQLELERERGQRAIAG
jgi:chromosome segregation ATPase